MAEQGKVTKTIKIENARIAFKNFSGRETDFNEEGNRNFGLMLDDPEMVEDLIADGWPVKFLKPRPDSEDPEFRQPWLPVKVKFGKFPPIANLITVDRNEVRHRTKLDENTIGMLDGARAENIDLIIRPYNYPAVKGRPAGVSAYLKAIYYTLPSDDLESKYADAQYD